MNRKKIIRQSLILSLLLFAGLFATKNCPSLRPVYAGGWVIFHYLVNEEMMSQHNAVMFFLIMYFYLLAMSAAAVLLIHAGIKAAALFSGGKPSPGRSKTFSLQRLFRNHKRGFVFGACGYFTLMLLVWSASRSGRTAEPFLSIARSMGRLGDSPYDVLNYPVDGKNPVLLVIHWFMWILWGGILGAALERFVRNGLSREIRPERAKRISLSDPDFRSCLGAGILWGTAGSLLLLAVNPLFLVFVQAYVWLCGEGTVTLGYWAIPVYLVCAILSGAIYGIIGFYLFHRAAPEERAVQPESDEG